LIGALRVFPSFLTFKVVSLALGSLCLLTSEARAASVPDDRSLSVGDYIELGVADPAREWSATDFEDALRLLETLEPEQLPRVASPRSQRLFERLLSRHRNEFELEPEKRGDVQREGAPPRSLTELYSPQGLLFARELVAIRAESLNRSLGWLTPRAETQELASQFLSMMEDATSPERRVQLRERVAQAERTGEISARLVKRQVSELLALAALEELGDVARRDLLSHVERSFDQWPRFLSRSDLRWIADLLSGAASMDWNATIARGLYDLGKALDQRAESDQ